MLGNPNRDISVCVWYTYKGIRSAYWVYISLERNILCLGAKKIEKNKRDSIKNMGSVSTMWWLIFFFDEEYLWVLLTCSTGYGY